MATISRTSPFDLATHVRTLARSVLDSRRTEPELEHAGLPRDRSGLGPILWFLASGVAGVTMVLSWGNHERGQMTGTRIRAALAHASQPGA